MRVIIEAEKDNHKITYQFDPLSIKGYVSEIEMASGERIILATALRVVANALDGGQG